MDEKTENPLGEPRAAHLRDAETANLDALIDDALAAYTAGEPRLDLSARILCVAHAQEPRRGPGVTLRPALSWVFAAAGWLAAAMLLVWINAHNLQIAVQTLPAAAQRAQSAPPTLSPFPAAAVSFHAAPLQSAARTTHFQHAIRVSDPRSQPSDRSDLLQPIAFAPIVIAPIGSGKGN